jgi:hypothetical protein
MKLCAFALIPAVKNKTVPEVCVRHMRINEIMVNNYARFGITYLQDLIRVNYAVF